MSFCIAFAISILYILADHGEVCQQSLPGEVSKHILYILAEHVFT